MGPLFCHQPMTCSSQLEERDILGGSRRKVLTKDLTPQTVTSSNMSQDIEVFSLDGSFLLGQNLRITHPSHSHSFRTDTSMEQCYEGRNLILCYWKKCPKEYHAKWVEGIERNVLIGIADMQEVNLRACVVEPSMEIPYDDDPNMNSICYKVKLMTPGLLGFAQMTTVIIATCDHKTVAMVEKDFKPSTKDKIESAVDNIQFVEVLEDKLTVMEHHYSGENWKGVFNELWKGVFNEFREQYWN